MIEDVEKFIVKDNRLALLLNRLILKKFYFFVKFLISEYEKIMQKHFCLPIQTTITQM